MSFGWRHRRLRGVAVVIGAERYQLAADGAVPDPSPAAQRRMDDHPNYERVRLPATPQPEPAGSPPEAEPDEQPDLEAMDRDALEALADQLGVRLHHRMKDDTVRQNIREHLEAEAAE